MLVFEKTGTPVQPELDKTGLENAIESAEALDLETYTPESAKNLEQALAAKGLNIDKKDITILAGEVKEVGEYEAAVKIYKAIKGTFKFNVVAE